MTHLQHLIQEHLEQQGIPTTAYSRPAAPIHSLYLYYDTYIHITPKRITCISEGEITQNLSLSDPQLLTKITNWSQHEYDQINHHIKAIHQHFQEHNLLNGYYEYRRDFIFISPQNLQFIIDDTTIHVSIHWVNEDISPSQYKIILQIDTNDPNYLDTIAKLAS